jgi:hypothetical protein
VPPAVGTSKRHRPVPNFGSRSFRDLVALRPVILQRLLSATNLTLLYNDIDMVWRQNAWDVVDEYRYHHRSSSSSLLLQEEEKNKAAPQSVLLWADGPQQVCSCLLYLDPTIESHALLDRWQEELQTGAYKNDQPALNAAVAALGGATDYPQQDTTTTMTPPLPQQQQDHAPWRIIRNYDQFPHGVYYFGRADSPVPPGDESYQKRRRQAVIVHNNWAPNKTLKTERFRQHGLWNLSPAMMMRTAQQ